MRQMRSCLFRLAGLFNKARRDRDLYDELESHLQFHVEENIRLGMTPDAARRDALIKLGGIEQTKERYRDQRGLPLLESFSQDLRFALRMLRKTPGFTAVSILTLTLGIGTSTAIFSVVNAVLLRRLPFPDPDRLVHLWETKPPGSDLRNVVDPWNFLDWRERTHSFEGMAATQSLTMNLTGAATPRAVAGLQVSPEFFSILGTSPLVGRPFDPEEGMPGNDQRAILSFDLWQSQFGGRKDILDQTIAVNGSSATIVGVMPPGFSMPSRKAEIWMPMALERSEQFRGHFLNVVARLKPGVTVRQAQQDLSAVADQLAQERPSTNSDWDAEVIPMLRDATDGVRLPLLVLLGSAGFLLLIACANVANLLLMRASGRTREIAIRTALGAGRGRIAQQLLIESLLLALAGCAAGVTLAVWGLDVVIAMIPHGALIPVGTPVPRMELIRTDAGVLAFAAGISLLTAFLSGLAPITHLASVDAGGALKPASLRTGAGESRLVRRSLVVAQIAVSLTLLTGAGLMARSFARLISVDPGFQPDRVLTAQMFCLPGRYGDRRKRSQYLDRLLAGIRDTPGVQAAGCINFLPLEEKASGSCFSMSGDPPPDQRSPSSHILVVSPGYFEAMATPLLGGRYFDDRDRFGSPSVAMLNQAFIERYFSGENPLGKRLNLCWSLPNPVEIVGVVANARQMELGVDPAPAIFLSNSQSPMYFVALVVRAQNDPRQIVKSVEAAVHNVDADQPLYDVRTMEQVRSDSVARPRFQLTLLILFGGIALVLSMIGVYGVLSYSVNRRTPELGIRFALGARAGDVVRLVMREGLVLAVLGIALGLGGAFALTRTLRSLLFEITPNDPLTMASVACLLLVTAAVATGIPARRASRVDPTTALREE
jgi:predicted permease